MNYEEAILQIQGKERYNVFALLAFSVMGFISAMDINSIVFISYIPSFECIDGAFNKTNVTWTKKECHGTVLTVNKTLQNVLCTRWKFNKDVMKRTIASEFNLVCDKEYIITLMNTLFFVGIAIGNFLSVSGDKIGRIRLIQILVIWEIANFIVLPFTTNIYMILVLRLISGFGSGKIYQGVCYLTEIISVDKRSIYTNNYWIFFVFGYMLIPGISYGVQDWRMIRHLMNIPMICYLFYFWMPESPRWLGIGGKIKKAKRSLLLIAKINGKQLPSNQFESLIVKKENLGNCTDIIGTRTMRIKTFVLMFAHGTICLCYFSLSINESFIVKNIFINVFIQGLIELFTGPVAWISSTKLNRKISLLMFFVITSTCLLLYNLINHKHIVLIALKFTFAFMGKFSLTTAYCIMDLYLNEVFPTSIRNMSIFIILGAASTFTILAPTINGLDKFIPYFSTFSFATMCFISGVLIYFFLPETKDCPLPQTLEHGEALKKGNEKNYCKMMTTNNMNILK